MNSATCSCKSAPTNCGACGVNSATCSCKSPPPLADCNNCGVNSSTCQCNSTPARPSCSHGEINNSTLINSQCRWIRDCVPSCTPEPHNCKECDSAGVLVSTCSGCETCSSGTCTNPSCPGGQNRDSNCNCTCTSDSQCSHLGACGECSGGSCQTQTLSCPSDSERHPNEQDFCECICFCANTGILEFLDHFSSCAELVPIRCLDGGSTTF